GPERNGSMRISRAQLSEMVQIRAENSTCIFSLTPHPPRTYHRTRAPDRTSGQRVTGEFRPPAGSRPQPVPAASAANGDEAEGESDRRALPRAVLSGAPRARSGNLRRRMTGQAIIEARELSMRFGGVVAVDGYSLTLGREDLTGLIGPNGAGKTTA